MKTEDRKAATTAYKERKVEAGIYKIGCEPGGQIWVGSAPDVSTIQNRLWFTLRMGTNSHRSLQEAWNSHGAEKVAFEIVERLEDEENAYIRSRLLKARLEHWLEKLGATRI